MDVDLRGRETRDAPRVLERARLHLRRGPDIAAVGSYVGRGVLRLHRRMGEKRALEGRCVRRAARDRRRVAEMQRNLRRRDERPGVLGERVARQSGVRPRVPPHRERASTREGGVGVRSNHGDAAADPHDGDDARDRLRLCRVEGPDGAAEVGRPLDARVDHVRDNDVDAVLRAAIDFRREIEPPHAGLADERERARLLERDVPRHRERRRQLDEVAVGRAAAARDVGDDARGRRALGGGDAPELCGGAHEHRAGRRTRGSQRQPHVGRARAPTRRHAPERRVGVGFADRRELDRDALERRVEFVRQDRGKARGDALAHLRFRDDHRDAIVGTDPQPRIGHERDGRWRLCRRRGRAGPMRAALERRDEAEPEAAGRREERAARRAHAGRFVARTASFTASTMRP